MKSELERTGRQIGRRTQTRMTDKYLDTESEGSHFIWGGGGGGELSYRRGFGVGDAEFSNAVLGGQQAGNLA